MPTVFFSDSTGGCYHTTGDDVGIVNFPKLEQQSALGFRTAVGLIEAATPPAFVPPNPGLATFEDALTLQMVLTTALPDLALFSPADQAQFTTFKTQVDQIVADGPGLFDAGDVGTVLGAAVTLIGTLTNVGCQAY